MKKVVSTFCLLLVLAPGEPAGAFIEAMYPFKQVLEQSTHILVGRVEKVDPNGKRIVATIERAIKGQAEFKQVQMNVGTGIAGHPEYLISRAAVGGPVLIFYQRSGNSIACEVHHSDTWFQLYCQDNPADRANVWWTMSHIEIKLGRTFNGSTAELIKLTEDILSGKAQPPAPDDKVPPLDVTAPRVTLSAGGKAGGFQNQAVFRYAGGEVGGVAWTDVNGDGLPDVYCCRQAGNVLLVNQKTGMEDQTTRVGLFGTSRAGVWADYDGDGRSDLLTGNFQLFTNVGGRFREDSKLIPAPPQRAPETAGWIDYDGDGLPDVLVFNGPYGAALFRNTGQAPNRFVDVSAQAGFGPAGAKVAGGSFATFFDYDGDGLTDVLYNVDKGLLLHNEGDGRFRVDASTGIELPGPPAYRRGVAVGDFDNDGDLDLFVPAQTSPRLYRNNNDGAFTDVTATAGDLAKLTDPSVSAAWGDVNNDGLPDLFVCCTQGGSRLYIGNGRGQFSDISEAAGVKALAPAMAASFADVNGDGMIDLAVNLGDRVVLAVNAIPCPPKRGSATVVLAVKRGATGAVVRAFDLKHRLLGRREINGAEGFGGQSPPVAHFGLPRAPAAISVCLSDGRSAGKFVEIKSKPVAVVFKDEDFQPGRPTPQPTTMPTTAPAKK